MANADFPYEANSPLLYAIHQKQIHCVLLYDSPLFPFLSSVLPLSLPATAAGNDAVKLYIASYVCFESIEGGGETDK